jgi:lysophospholipase L1-like esterase
MAAYAPTQWLALSQLNRLKTEPFHLAHDKMQLAALEIGEDASFVPVAPSGRRWLAFGDSITQGMTSTLPTRSYVSQVARALDLDLWNFGVGGERLVSVLADGVPQVPFMMATIAYGTNDLVHGVPLEVWCDNAVKLARALHAAAPAAWLLFITPIPWVGHPMPNAGGLSLSDYRTALATALCELRKVLVVDGTSLIDERDDLFVDSIHPNDRGFALYTERLTAVMRPHLPPKKQARLAGTAPGAKPLTGR